MPGSHLSSETLRLPLSRDLINTEKQKSSTRDHLGFPMHRFQRLTDTHVYPHYTVAFWWRYVLGAFDFLQHGN